MCSNAGVGDGGAVVAVKAAHEYVGGTRGSCIVPGTYDVLGMSQVRGREELECVIFVWLGRCGR